MSSLPTINPSEESDRITAFIRDTFTKAHKTTAIVAVSGGLDSATVLSLTAKALGPNHTLALHLPAHSTPPNSTRLANLAMDTASIPPQNRLTIPVTALIQKSWRIINHFTPKPETKPGFRVLQNPVLSDLAKTEPGSKSPNPTQTKPGFRTLQNRVLSNRLRLANIAARSRMLILYDQAKLYDALVVGTENYSEYLLGYFTRFGDEASDLEPLHHLYKTQVIELAKFLGLPQEIIERPPSADLWSGQTDAGELGFTYREADPILYLHSQGKTAKEIATNFDPKLVTAILNTVSRNHFKHQVPYIFSL